MVVKTTNPEAVAAATTLAAQRWPHLLNETTGQIENCQVSVYLAYTTTDAHALIDHRLYLPTSWTDDSDRLRAAGVPEQVEFATKPELARQMIATALEHVPHAWVAGDEVYGRNPGLRSYLEKHRLGYVMEMAATDTLATPRGAIAVKEPAVLVPEQGWQKRSAGAGAKGERFYDWALIDDRSDEYGVRWVLIRRNRTTGELAFFHCYAPEVVPLARLVAVAGRRWRVEESFQQGKGLAGLDEHQVRTWTSWHRWSLLAMTAYAFLALCRARELRHRPVPSGVVELTCNEIARLLEALFPPESGLEHVLAWSVFRRIHQAHARRCHYRRQAVQES